MKLKLIVLIQLFAVAAFAQPPKSDGSKKEEPKSKIQRSIASAEICQTKQANYRAFVITGIHELGPDNFAQLTAPNGATSDSIECSSTYSVFRTIDVDSSQRGHHKIFNFVNHAECNGALAKFRGASKEIPVVIVIDRDCKAHWAY